MPRSKSSHHSKINDVKPSKPKPKPSKSKSSKSKSSKSKSSKPKSTSKSKQEIVAIYCAIYRPYYGNYYHWALALHHQTTEQWLIFEVVQEDEDAPFEPKIREANPTDSRRCESLLPLGVMDAGWMMTFEERRQEILVPGEALSWNCQDYVFDMWAIMGDEGMITEATYDIGYATLLPYYGQDFGGQGEELGEEENEEGEGNEEAQEGPFQSEEFVYDSGSTEQEA